jgi:dCMP deaminase
MRFSSCSIWRFQEKVTVITVPLPMLELSCTVDGESDTRTCPRFARQSPLPQHAFMAERAEQDEYFFGIALAVRERANCRGQRVGAVLVQDNRIISTGYNGVAEKMRNCEDDGCYRCANREQFQSGTAYDLCICVHAEQNALLSAGRFGSSPEGGAIYTTTRPCFGCTKELLQAKVDGIHYMHDWRHPDDQVRAEYEKLQNRFPGGLNRLTLDDPRADWALGRTAEDPPDTGHTIPGNEGDPI